MKKNKKAISIIVIIILLISYFFFYDENKSIALSKRHNLTFVLGKEIKKRFPDNNILILANPFKKHSYSDFDLKGIEGIKDSLRGSVDVQVSYPEIYPQFKNNPGSVLLPNDTKTPLSYMVNPASLDSLMQKFPNHTMVVSLIGIPMGIQNTKMWASTKHSIALIDPDMRIIGSMNLVKKAFATGKISLACVKDGENIHVIDASNIASILVNKKYLLGY